MHDCLINGEIADTISVADRGLNYGDGLFETLLVRRGQPRFWQAHMERLDKGCGQLGIARPEQSLLWREVQTVIAGRPECVVKIIVTRGVPASGFSRGYAPPEQCAVSRIVSAHDPPQDRDHGPAGVRVRICELRLGQQSLLAGIKHLNRLEQVMARAEWDDPEIGEGILLDQDGYVVSGTASNIFIVAGQRLLTPRLDRCGVRGIMRGEILKAFAARCEQRRITLDMLPEADEVFLCNGVRGIMPVGRIDDRRYDLGPVTAEVREWLDLQ